MSADLPSHLLYHNDHIAGRGLSTKATVAAGKEILEIERPLAAALNTSHLRDTCDNCYIWVPSSSQGRGSLSSSSGVEVKLKDCLGCKVVRYCSRVRRVLNMRNFGSNSVSLLLC